jgi:hypothetical protein
MVVLAQFQSETEADHSIGSSRDIQVLSDGSTEPINFMFQHRRETLRETGSEVISVAKNHLPPNPCGAILVRAELIDQVDESSVVEATHRCALRPAGIFVQRCRSGHGAIIDGAMLDRRS